MRSYSLILSVLQGEKIPDVDIVESNTIWGKRNGAQQLRPLWQRAWVQFLAPALGVLQLPVILASGWHDTSGLWGYLHGLGYYTEGMHVHIYDLK